MTKKKNNIDNFLEKLDWRVNENSNNGDPTPSGLMLYLANTEIAKHTLNNVYPKEISDLHRNGDLHIHDLGYGTLLPYCCGWSLEALIKEGINKIQGKASSAPAKHLSSLMIQMVNFLGCLQMEASGAMAFNNVDTYLSAFVKNDNLSFYKVKQFMQQLVFNLNIPSRWGCLSDDSEILTKNGWKYYYEVNQNELIATFNIQKNHIEYKPIQWMNVYNYNGELINIKIEDTNILTTPTHRNVVLFNNNNSYSIIESYQLTDIKSSKLPIYIDSEIVNKSYEIDKPVKYTGKVWCPTVENSTFIARRNGTAIVTGNSQPPFTNFTFDIKCPKDMEDKKAIVGGVEQDFTYGDCQAEMDMLNIAFMEIMEEGDSDGQIHTFPIPTYNIDKNFDWESPVTDKLCEMTAKYGVPYFANYVNSSMESSDVRSMAILGTQNIFYKNEFNRVSKNEIRHLVSNWTKNTKKPQYKILMNGKFVDIIDMFEVPYPAEKYPDYIKIALDNGIEQSFSYEHKCAICRNDEYMEVESQDVQIGDHFLISNTMYDESKIGNYETGKIVGFYLGDGWQNSHSKSELSFVININKTDIVEDIKTYFLKLGCNVKIEKQDEAKIFKINVYGNQAIALITEFIGGKTAKTKRLTTKIWNTSVEFRKGLFDGILKADGFVKEKNIMHTTNKDLILDLMELCNSIGVVTKLITNKNNTRSFKKDKSDLVKFTSYKLNITNKYSRKTFKFGEFTLVPVTDVINVKSKTNKVYNFTVNTKEHLYELPNGIITHQCCRLRLDLSELRKRGGGFFGAGDNTGSIGVVTINLPRIGYQSTTVSGFYERLDYLLIKAKESLDLKRIEVNKMFDKGFLPYMKRYLKNGYDNHFSTIGIVGMNECSVNMYGSGMETDIGIDFANEVMDHINKRLSEFQVKSKEKTLYNLEATPAEATSYRFAKHDKEKYPKIITANNTGIPYYTNSVHLPVGLTDDIFEVLEKQDSLQAKFTSGTVLHLYLGERIENKEVVKKLLQKIMNNYTLPYVSITPTFSTCIDCGYIIGEKFKCPTCGKDTLVWSRVTGYLRPVQNWNIGKKQEFEDRKYYKLKE